MVELRRITSFKLALLECDPITRLIPVDRLLLEHDQVQHKTAEAAIPVIPQELVCGEGLDRTDAPPQTGDGVCLVLRAFDFLQILVERGGA